MDSSRMGASLEDEAIASLLAAGLDERAVARLVAVKSRCREGRLSELTHESLRLEFVKWLFLHGRLKG